jgi:hypothetical protein
MPSQLSIYHSCNWPIALCRIVVNLDRELNMPFTSPPCQLTFQRYLSILLNKPSDWLPPHYFRPPFKAADSKGRLHSPGGRRAADVSRQDRITCTSFGARFPWGCSHSRALQGPKSAGGRLATRRGRRFCAEGEFMTGCQLT